MAHARYGTRTDPEPTGEQDSVAETERTGGTRVPKPGSRAERGCPQPQRVEHSGAVQMLSGHSTSQPAAAEDRRAPLAILTSAFGLKTAKNHKHRKTDNSSDNDGGHETRRHSRPRKV